MYDTAILMPVESITTKYANFRMNGKTRKIMFVGFIGEFQCKKLYHNTHSIFLLFLIR